MDLAVRWHRLLRALTFVLGLVIGLGLAVFIFSNAAPVDIHWKVPTNTGPEIAYTVSGISVWLLAVVPLVLGLVLGYLYQTPARMHHVRIGLQHHSRVKELEHELKELRMSLDKVLAMPEDGELAVPAALLAPLEAEISLPDEPSAAALLEEAKPADPPKLAKPNGRRRGAPVRPATKRTRAARPSAKTAEKN